MATNTSLLQNWRQKWKKSLSCSKIVKEFECHLYTDEKAKNTMLDIQQNGKQVIVPIVIDGFGKQNNLRIDSNAVTSIYGKDFSISKVLYNALNDEADGKPFSVYYVDVKKATTLMQKARVLMPKSSAISANGFIHSIDEAGSPVKKKFSSVTETQQFKRWFGKSKIVDSDGNPLVMYHGTRAENGDFTVFDSSKAVKKAVLV